jgi:hypothetical protein
MTAFGKKHLIALALLSFSSVCWGNDGKEQLKAVEFLTPLAPEIQRNPAWPAKLTFSPLPPMNVEEFYKFMQKRWQVAFTCDGKPDAKAHLLKLGLPAGEKGNSVVEYEGRKMKELWVLFPPYSKTDEPETVAESYQFFCDLVDTGRNLFGQDCQTIDFHLRKPRLFLRPVSVDQTREVGFEAVDENPTLFCEDGQPLRAIYLLEQQMTM